MVISEKSADSKIKTQAEFFANRLKKRAKHLRKWAFRNGIHAYRIYGKDIPEIPLDIDFYEDADTRRAFLHAAFYSRKYEKDPAEEESWIETMLHEASEALGVPRKNIFLKVRKRNRGAFQQYEKLKNDGVSFFTDECGALLKVNLSDYLDTGLFLDHRPLRLKIRREAAGLQVLNLFCYAGAFSVQAAAGGADTVTSVDLSAGYLARARESVRRNEFEHSGSKDQKHCRHEFVRADVIDFLLEKKGEFQGRKWDIIICDPPTFSNSKKTKKDFDIARDWRDLCEACLARLNSSGTLYFSSSAKRLPFKAEEIRWPDGKKAQCKDITQETIGEDFKGKRPHRCWEIKR